MSFFSNLFNKRRNEIRKMADDLDMDFYNSDEYGLVDYLEGFKIFSEGRRKSIKNMLIRVDGTLDLDIRIFDYQFVVGGGNSTHVFKQTIFYLHSKKLSLPQFLLKPEHFFHKIGHFLGMPQDINFEAFPEFSKQYLLKGENEEEVRATLNDDVLHFFTVEKNWSLEGHNNTLLFYKKGKRQSPETIKDFYNKGLLIYKMLINEKGFGGYGEFV
jgi:hypothetical protein